ncbi:hypothetical protein HDK90DRAFT_134378 [Phyllosticta capitalensis]|uniref:Uncharacterized protein n=1 Tax=Phyllosticta capitalensis TaxID=121624 RepID=A0ABR1YYL1_9PEZI
MQSLDVAIVNFSFGSFVSCQKHSNSSSRNSLDKRKYHATPSMQRCSRSGHGRFRDVAATVVCIVRVMYADVLDELAVFVDVGWLRSSRAARRCHLCVTVVEERRWGAPGVAVAFVVRVVVIARRRWSTRLRFPAMFIGLGRWYRGGTRATFRLSGAFSCGRLGLLEAPACGFITTETTSASSYKSLRLIVRLVVVHAISAITRWAVGVAPRFRLISRRWTVLFISIVSVYRRLKTRCGWIWLQGRSAVLTFRAVPGDFGWIFFVWIFGGVRWHLVWETGGPAHSIFGSLLGFISGCSGDVFACPVPIQIIQKTISVSCYIWRRRCSGCWFSGQCAGIGFLQISGTGLVACRRRLNAELWPVQIAESTSSRWAYSGIVVLDIVALSCRWSLPTALVHSSIMGIPAYSC